MSQSGYPYIFARNFLLLSRVSRFLPMLQVQICFLRLPPGFPAVPQHFNHVSADPIPSQQDLSNYLSSLS
jgi:hypothetical protein